MAIFKFSPASVTLTPRDYAAQRTTASGERESQTALWDEQLWTYRPGAERVLAAVPRATWGEPARHGWVCVKANPRRDVWRAEINGRAFYLKYFFPSSGLRRLRELYLDPPGRSEWESGLYALRHDVPAVQPAAHTVGLRRDGKSCALLITQALEPAYPLPEFWRQVCGDPDRARRRADTTQILERLAELIARAHQSGFEHTDMHAANILVQSLSPGEYRCAFVDLHSARMNVAIRDDAVVHNLAQLNQWFRKNSPISDRIRFLRAYFRWRNALELAYPQGRPLGLRFEELVHQLAVYAEEHAQALWARRDRRAERDSRYFARCKPASGWSGNVFLCTKHPTPASQADRREFTKTWWKSAWRQIDAALQAPGADVRKDSHSARVVRATLDHADGPLDVIIKQPRARNWRRALAQLWPPSRSRRAWRLGNALLHRDLPAARPLAVFEQRRGLLVRESRIVIEALPHAADLEAHLKFEQQRCNPSEWRAHKSELTRMLAALVRRLADRWIAHRDCKASNVLVLTRPELRLVWIDMDGLKLRGRPLTREEEFAPLVRLHVSLLSQPGLTRTDRVRFLKHYFARFGSGAGDWRTIWRKLSPLADEKLAQRARRSAWKQKHYGRE